MPGHLTLPPFSPMSIFRKVTTATGQEHHMPAAIADKLASDEADDRKVDETERVGVYAKRGIREIDTKTDYYEAEKKINRQIVTVYTTEKPADYDGEQMVHPTVDPKALPTSKKDTFHAGAGLPNVANREAAQLDLNRTPVRSAGTETGTEKEPGEAKANAADADDAAKANGTPKAKTPAQLIAQRTGTTPPKRTPATSAPAPKADTDPAKDATDPAKAGTDSDPAKDPAKASEGGDGEAKKAEKEGE